MKLQSYIIALTAALATAAAWAWQTPVGPAPTPAFIDMERTTNVVIQAESLQRCRVFECFLSLPASPSSALEVAFGKSRNGDEALLPGEETFAIDWEGDAWFVASATSRICSALHEDAARRSLSFMLRVSEDDVPRTLSFSADGMENAFSSVAVPPPVWMFSRAWDMVRLAVRGIDEAEESVSVRFGPNPVFLILG
jgi:hypothetical protein